MREFLQNYVNPEDVLKSDLLTLKTFIKTIKTELDLSPNDPAILAAERIIKFSEQYTSYTPSSYYSLYQQLEEIQAQVAVSTARGVVGDAVIKELFNSLIALLFKWLLFEVQNYDNKSEVLNHT